MESAGPSPELYRDESETAARFLIRSNQFALSHQRVRPQAFYPSKRDHRVSVFIIDGLEDPQIWYLGEEHVAKPQGRTVLARGELTGNQVSEVGDLRLNRDDHPPRHANIDGWPADKDEWKLLAQELAGMARLHARSD